MRREGGGHTQSLRTRRHYFLLLQSSLRCLQDFLSQLHRVGVVNRNGSPATKSPTASPVETTPRTKVAIRHVPLHFFGNFIEQLEKEWKKKDDTGH